VVITSVDRDDLKDGGASILPASSRKRASAWETTAASKCSSPDFKGEEAPLRGARARPDVLNHNTETVPRLYRMARSGGRYSRTLELLDRSRHIAPDIPTKTGLMVGLGEARGTAGGVQDLRDVGCQISPSRQYLRPTQEHAPMTRYYTPEEFRELKQIALDMGFVHVESGPLVRSSYHAHETADAYAAAAAQG
jgi:lipoic acid synthetase